MVKIVEKTGATINSTRKFVWAGQQKVEFRDATDAVTQRNYPQGQYVGTTAYFYTRDHLGSIREMFTGGGTVVARYDYDPYGRSTTVLGTTPTDFNFTGLYRHSKSNLDLAVYRAYDPDLGRWLNRDPIAEQGGVNLYAYVNNSPLKSVDLLGLMSELFRFAHEAADAGARADLWEASRNKFQRGGVEYFGRVCKAKCAVGGKQYYYTGPMRGEVGKSFPDRAPCAPGDEPLGAHYAHPDGTDIPVIDQQVSAGGLGPLALAIPFGNVNSPTVKVIHHGHWPN
jgi:RHS repeat-associated protein